MGTRQGQPGCLKQQPCKKATPDFHKKQNRQKVRTLADSNVTYLREQIKLLQNPEDLLNWFIQKANTVNNWQAYLFRPWSMNCPNESSDNIDQRWWQDKDMPNCFAIFLSWTRLHVYKSQASLRNLSGKAFLNQPLHLSPSIKINIFSLFLRQTFPLTESLAMWQAWMIHCMRRSPILFPWCWTA